MKYQKKSLGQNFLIEKNIVRKILSLTSFKGKNIIEIGPGKGALTDEIIKMKPKLLILIEKDEALTNYLNSKYSLEKTVKIYNTDILNFDFEKINKDKIIIIGNLPYNISSQILIKILRYKKIKTKFEDLIFMFQKELGEKIIGKFPSKNYGRLSIITNFRLRVIKKFLVSANCFFPKPKVTSMVIHFKTLKKNLFNINNISNLEKITNILFSNKRKMINKRISHILNNQKIKKLPNLNLKLRPEKISPETFYKITELYEED